MVIKKCWVCSFPSFLLRHIASTIRSNFAYAVAILLLLSLTPALHAGSGLIFFSSALTPVNTGSYTLSTPGGTAVDSSGNVYVADSAHNRVLEVSPADVTTVLATTSGVSLSTLSAPNAVAVDSNGTIYIANTGQNQIVEVTSAGVGSVLTSTSGIVLTTLSGPRGIAVDKNLTVYIADTGKSRVVEVTSAGVASALSTGSESLTSPSAVAVDSSLNIYIADSSSNRIVKVPASGSASLLSFSSLSPSTLSAPAGLAVDSSGNVYIADTGNSRILKYASGTSTVLVALPGNSPSGIATDSSGNFYIAGSTNQLLELETVSAHFQSVAVGSSANTTLTFSLLAGTTVTAINVLTQGAPNLDFQPQANDTSTTLCPTSSTAHPLTVICTVDVTFAPTVPGQRMGAIVFANGTSVDGTVYTDGTGVGPLTTFAPAIQTFVADGVSTGANTPQTYIVDGNGDGYMLELGLGDIVKIPNGCTSVSCQVIWTMGLSNPRGMAMDAAGNFYFTNYGNNTVTEAPAGCTSSSCQISIGGFTNANPWNVAVDGSGNLYVTNYVAFTVVKVPAGCTTTGCEITLASSLSGRPTGIAVDAAGDVFFAELLSSPSSVNVMEIPAGCSALTCELPIATGITNAGTQPALVLDASGALLLTGASNVTKIPAGCTTAACQTTVGSGMYYPSGLSFDLNGNLYATENDANTIYKVALPAPPAITFNTTTNVGSSDTSENPKVITVTNGGNSPLSFSLPATGNNPGVTAAFPLDAVSTCPQLTASSQTPGSLAIGGSCTYAIDFAPTAAGTNSGTLVVVDTTLNVASSQTINLTGTGRQNGDLTSTTVTASPTSIGSGGTATLTATVVDTTKSSTPSGPVSFTDTIGSTTVSLNSGNPVSLNGSGVAILTGATLTGDGVHTIKATYAGVNGSFTGSNNSTSVTVGAATHFSLTVPASTVQNSSFTVTVTAIDANNAPTTSYSGTVAITSNDPAAVLPANAALSGGVGTFTVTLKTLGVQSIAATDTVTSTITGSTSIQVTPPPTFTVTVATDDASGIVANCTNQSLSGATLDASCSLRDAIAAAAAVSTASVTPTVNFASALTSAAPSTITLDSGGTLNLSANMNIVGPGARLLSLSGASTYQIATIGSGVTASISGLTFTKGLTSSQGGAIFDSGNLTVSQSVFTSNVASVQGGAIATSGTPATLTVTNSTFSGNTANGNGGALNNGVGSTMTITGTTFLGNSAGVSGGAIGNAGPLTLTNSTLTGNAAVLARGGAIYNTSSVTTTLINTTIVGNSATTFGGGIFVNSGVIVAANSIVGGNVVSEGSYADIDGSLTDNGGNLIGTGAGSTSTMNPNLAALGNYGGLTQTMPPLPGSPAICQGTTTNANGIPTDQRGNPRSTTIYSSSPCVDAGAVQTAYSLSFSTQPSNGQAKIAFTPAPAVQLNDNGTAIALPGAPITMLASAGTLTGTLSASTSTTGIATFSNLVLGVSQSNDTLKASSAAGNFTITATSNTFNVTSVDHFTITVPATATAGSGFSVTITAYDAGNNVLTGYTGPVTFTSTDVQALLPGSTTLTNGTATAQVTLDTAGSQTITVADSSGSPSTPSASIVVSPTTPSEILVAAGSGQSAVIGTPFSTSLTARLTDLYGNPVSGVTVSFAPPVTGASATLSSQTAVTAANGTASVTASANGIATTSSYVVKATSASIQQFASFALTNTQAATTVTVTHGATTLVYGQPVTISASIAPATVLTSAPTGSVTFYDGTVALTPNSTVAGAAATYAVTTPTVGSHTYAAKYLGDTNFAVSAQASAASAVLVGQSTVTVTGPTQTVQVTVDSTTATIPLILTGQYPGTGVSAPGGAASATVTYTYYNSSNAAVASSSAPVTAGATQSTATIPVPSSVATVPGTYTLNVLFSGDIDYKATNGNVYQILVGQLTPVVTWSQPGAIIYGTPLGALLNPAALNGTAPVPGSFTYTATPAGGSATAITGASVLHAGSYILTATFTPTDTTTYKTVTGTASLTVNQATPAIGLASSASPVFVQSSVTLTATVSSAASVPTGTVNFLYGTTSLGSSPVVAGVAILTTSALPIGSDSITAVYSGDPNFITQTSLAATVIVQDFTLNISTAGGSIVSQTVLPGGIATYNLVVSPVDGTVFPAAVNFTVSGLPAGATATFSPQTLATGSGSTNVVLTIQTAQQNAVLQHDNRFSGGFMPIALSILLLPFSQRLRRSSRKLGRATSLALLLLIGLGAVAGLTGCGSGSGYFSQAQQTYNVTVTGNSGTLTHSTTVTLTVE
jgi:hypothetical protein